jgi:lipopolysaccharide transport system ATP-binding protein
MSKPIIEIEGIGKRYRIGAKKEPYLTLRGELTKWLSPAVRRARAAEEEFWALRDVGFRVEQGEAIGIIGRNGAGKSTLLKILSQITPPTEGKITMRGRVGSLLEVGTGFHPELTGRENIYMNGSILGMSRREIARKFDEIVAFAEMEKFLDTPAKRYSSGMYVRLAFAVAAHLEPEILIIDEVLAVGDARFQVKCIGKMGEVAKSGRTILFVSHNMGAVLQLCGRGVALRDGRISCVGTVRDVVDHYMEQPLTCNGVVEVDELRSSADKKPKAARFVRVSLLSGNGSVADTFYIGEPMTVRFDVVFEQPVENPMFTFVVRSIAGENIYHCSTLDDQCSTSTLCGAVSITATFPRLGLYPGSYVIDDLWMATPSCEELDNVRDVLGFNVADGGPNVFRRLARERAVVHEVPVWKIK